MLNGRVAILEKGSQNIILPDDSWDDLGICKSLFRNDRGQKSDWSSKYRLIHFSFIRVVQTSSKHSSKNCLF